MKHLLISFLLVALGLMQAAAQVNYSEHIAPIIYDNCTSCHRPGEIGPFSLTNYNEASSWATMIQYVTEIKYMPPWKPDPTYSHFVGEKGLTDEEILLIAEWVFAGTPQGNPDLEPPLPSFPSGSQLGTPDLVLEMAEDYMIEGNNEDDYRVFVLPTGLLEDKEIAAMEFRPGNTKAVHHALLAYETEGAAAALDAQSPGYGYEAFGGFGVQVQGSFTGYTPGIEPIFFPEGIGTTLPAGADLIMQIHYAPLPTDETDKSLVNIFFKEPNDPISRELQRMPITPYDLLGGPFSFIIPPNEVTTFHGTKTINEDISMISVYPHCHYLGQDWDLFAITPDNDTINIIRINEWDFNWQGSYTFRKMKKIPAGSIMHIFATYDNTANNPFNPNTPPQSVTWGEGTTDEMYLVGTTYVPYQMGDEDIILGNDMTTNIETVVGPSGNRLYAPFPNPSRGQVAINFFLQQAQTISVHLLDANGTCVRTMLPPVEQHAGNHLVDFNVQGLSAGMYSIHLISQGMALSRPLIIAE